MSNHTNKIPARVWTLLTFAWVAQAGSQILTFGNGMMMPSIIADFGIDVGVMGRIGLLAGIASVIVTVPITLIAPKFNPKYFMTAIILAIAAGLFIYGTAAGVNGLYIGKIITGFLGQGIAAALVLVKVRSVPHDKMQSANGLENFVGPIGQIIATLFMAQFLSLVNGWRNVYMVLGIVMIICAVGWFVTYGKGSMMVYNTTPKADKKVKREGESALKIAASNKNVWLVALSWPFTTLIWLAMFTYWPTYAVTTYGFELKQVGMILAFIPIFSAIASVTSPMIANKIGKDKPLIWPWGFILPVIYFAMINVRSVPLLCMLAAIAGYGAYCFVPLAMTLIYKLGMPPDAVSAGVGITLTCISIGTTLGGGVVGILGDKLGLYNAMAISCLAPVIFGVLTLMLPELGRKKMEEVAQAKVPVVVAADEPAVS